MSGGSLASRLAEVGGPLPLDELLNLAVDILTGIRDLHGLVGMVHCDLKPHNVLLDDEGRGWLCDFGLTQWAQQSMQSQARHPPTALSRRAGSFDVLSCDGWCCSECGCHPISSH